MKSDFQKQLDRIHRAAVLIASGAVESNGNGLYSVRSQSKSKTGYKTTSSEQTSKKRSKEPTTKKK